jgi:hypothetical protein
MKDLVQGKGIYIWQIWRSGPVEEIIANVKRAGMMHIIPKIADGNYEYVGNAPYLSQLLSMAHDLNIKVTPYHYVYGAYAKSEAIRIIQELKKYPYDGLVINAETQYRDLPNSATAAQLYCETVREAFPDLPLYLSTFRFPSYHRGFPFKTFLKYMDGNMPQVYWMQSNGTVPAQLDQTIAEYASLTDVPMIPTGAAFNEHGWAALPEDQKIFVDEAKEHNLRGCNWWEYRHAFVLRPELGQAIIDSSFEADEPQEPVEPPVIIPTPEDVIFRARCVAGQLNVRSTPEKLNDNSNWVRYLYFGDEVNVYEERFNDNIEWFRIGQMEWCSGYPTYMQKIEEPVEPPQELTDKQKLDILWEREFPNGYEG